MRTLVTLLLTTPLLAGEEVNTQPVAYQQYFDERRVFEPLDMATDTTGNLWITTPTAVLRFDGSRYLTIDTPLAGLRRICRPGDGSLWLAGPKGLLRYHSGRFAILSDEAVSGLACTATSTVFTANPKLRRWSPSGEFHDLDAQANRELVAAEDGRIWFGCATDICVLSGDQTQRIAVTGGKQWIAAVGSPRGRVFASLQTGIFELKDKSPIQINDRLVNPLRERAFVVPDKSHSIYAEGYSGVADLTGNAEHWAVPIGGAFPISAYPDGSHGLWMGTLAAGILHLDPTQTIHRWTRNDTLNGELHSVHPIGSRALVAGASGVFLLSPEGVQRLLSDHVYSLARNKDETFWAVTLGNGLVRADLRGRVLARLTDPDPDVILKNDLRDVFRDRRGQLWVAGKTGLYRIEESSTPRLIPHPPLEKSYISDMQEDQSGNLWIVGEGALWRHSGTGIQPHRFEAALPNTRYRSLAIRSPEDLWIGYRVGIGFSHLYRRDGKWKVDHFDDASVPGTRDTHFLRADSRGWIWRGTREGVFVTPSQTPQLDDWVLLYSNNGLRGGAASMRGFREETDGSIWITTYEAVTRFHPKTSWFDESGWKSWISSLRWNEQLYLDPSTYPAQLPAGTHRLQFQIGKSVTYPTPPVRLQYRLRGRHEDWRTAKTFEHELQIDDPGEYALETRLIFAGKTSPPARYAFSIAAPWYRSTLFYGLSGSLTGIAFLLYRMRPLWLMLFFTRLRYRMRLVSAAVSLSREPAPASSKDWTGQLLQCRYSIIRHLAHGGFSSVHLAKDTQNEDRLVAVKSIRIQPDIRDWQYRRFGQEVAALNSIQHPSVIRIEDSWIDTEGQPVLVMPYVEGPSLRDCLKNPPEGLNKKAILTHLASAITEMHRRGVVHCDLKPDNILIRQTPQGWIPVIIDFGVSGLRQRPEHLSHFTRAVGTPPYMAHEQLLGHFGVATDVYAFAVIALELLYGMPTRATGLSWDWTSATALRQWLPAPIASHFAAALESNPAKRATDPSPWLERLFAIAGQPLDN